MKNIDELKKHLGSGDNIMISKISGVPIATVHAVMRGARKTRKGQGYKVLVAANRLVESKNALLGGPTDEQQELQFTKDVA